MNHYTAVIGTITNIEYITNNAQTGGCTILNTLEGENPSGPFQVQLSPNVFVMNLHPFQVGDRVTFFFDKNAPMVLSYPPRYNAIAAAYTPYGTSAMLDIFQNHLVNTENTLKLNLAGDTPVTLQNGQPFFGDINGYLLLVLYSMTTRSIPAQTTPDQVVVFCQTA